ncbi:hypothetical protein SUNI508_02510 [Seiridium unicorne]|uniref:Uncharacterized protein n=1 Tax=Seiridium unicorne TaxID=138068 RepID=A0ABR2UFK4_9PEZI
MRPHTPTINTSRMGPNVNSPPETPTAGSPTFSRKAGAGSKGRKEIRGGPRHSSIPSLGGVGDQFAYARGIRPEEISPRSSDSSDDESDGSGSPPRSPRSDTSESRPPIADGLTHVVVVEAAFEIEECSEEDEDAMDSDDDDVLRPYGIEYPESDRSRSRSRSAHEVDPQLMNSLQDLTTCFQSDEDESDSDVDGDYGEYLRELKLSRQQRRARRMTQGSISKRTISERGSDSDREDLQPWDTGDVNQRRLRRKVDRRSLLSIPPEIIIELKEPNSDGEVVWDEHEINLARELPFWTMEVDSE